jgi:hypothetical protein
MRYILDNEGYVKVCSKTEIVCESKTCTAYEGDVPEGYETIEEWVQNANINAYKVVDGQLVYDAAREAELEAKYKKQSGTSFAQMFTNGFPTFTATTQVTTWATDWNIEQGDFVCEPLNSRIKIPAGSAEYVEIFGHVSGSGYALFNFEVVNGTVVHQTRDLFQFGGNYYWASPLSSMIVKIGDTSIDSYVILNSGGYNSTYSMNSGFASSATYIGVKKIG